MFSVLMNLSWKEKLLYGTGVLIGLIVFFGGFGLIYVSFTGGGTSSEPATQQNTRSNTASNTTSSASGDINPPQNGENVFESTIPFTPAQITSPGVQAFRVVGEQIIYVDSEDALKRTSLRTGEEVTLDTLDINSPSYMYIPPQENPDFIIVKEQGEYKTLRLNPEKVKFTLSENITYLTVEPVSETVYAIVDPADSVTEIQTFDITGGNERKILSRKGLSRVQFAGNRLFYTAENTLYEYDLSETAERTIVKGEEGIPKFNMNGDYYVGLVSAGQETYLYRFADANRELQTLNFTANPHQIAWSNQERALLFLKDGQLHTFTWEDPSLTQEPFKMADIEPAYTYMTTGFAGRVLFQSRSDKAIYRLVQGI